MFREGTAGRLSRSSNVTEEDPQHVIKRALFGGEPSTGLEDGDGRHGRHVRLSSASFLD
jgi:hypothetical protein